LTVERLVEGVSARRMSARLRNYAQGLRSLLIISPTAVHQRQRYARLTFTGNSLLDDP
jgi:hypothetical protein